MNYPAKSRVFCTNYNHVKMKLIEYTVAVEAAE